MGVSIKGRGGISKTTPTGPKAESTVKGASVKRGILGPNAQRDILRGAGARDVSMRQPRTSGARGGLVDLKVTGWEKSKASENADQGISALIQWLEKKASTKLGTKRRVKIRKVCCHHYYDRRPFGEFTTTSGPPSMKINLGATTAIQSFCDRLPHGRLESIRRVSDDY